jgi:hypothetical protein
MTRLIKSFWFFSLILFLGTLLYVYASLPEPVELFFAQGGSIEYISKDHFFYFALAIVSISNVVVYTFARHLRDTRNTKLALSEGFTRWLFSFSTLLNFFFMVVCMFFSVVNSGENFDPDNFGFLIFLSLGLMAFWLIGLPFVILRRKI